ncbi:MAG TPA: hypothetical protein VK163_05520 [Opitutaceae bacterium]|nr:hypothetical protein [Opitutaceae bacterium]
MKPLAANEVRRQLRYNYTPDERREKGQQLADTHIKLGSVNEELDRVKSEYKSRITTLENEIGLLSTQVSTGYEMREYVCAYKYDHPSKGRKSLYRVEPPQDLICEEEMTIADRQTILESIEKQAAEEQAKSGKPTEKPEAPKPGSDEDVRFAELLAQSLAGAKITRDDGTGFVTDVVISDDTAKAVMRGLKASELLRWHDWLTAHLDRAGAMQVDSILFDVLAETERRLKAEKAAPKRRQSAAGVVACESDGKDLRDPDESKNQN